MTGKESKDAGDVGCAVFMVLALVAFLAWATFSTTNKLKAQITDLTHRIEVLEKGR